MESSVLVQHDLGAASNYVSMLEQAAALVGEVLGHMRGSQRPQHRSPTAPPRGFSGKLHSPDHLKSLGMGVMTYSAFCWQRKSLPTFKKGGEETLIAVTLLGFAPILKPWAKCSISSWKWKFQLREVNKSVNMEKAQFPPLPISSAKSMGVFVCCSTLSEIQCTACLLLIEHWREKTFFTQTA